MDEERLAGRHVVLLGIGHTNAHIVRMWRMNPIPDTDLTCISDQPLASYSGMLPAVLANQIPRQQMFIDLVRLCSSVGARLILDRPTGLDRDRREVRFAERPPIPFDVLSIGIGSVPSVSEVDVSGDALLKIKPMQTFLERLAARVQGVLSTRDQDDRSRLKVIVVGAGVAGLEILFCLTPFLDRLGVTADLHLVTRSPEILPGVAGGTRRRAEEEINRRGHALTVGRAVAKVAEGRVNLDDGSEHPADLVIWATGATGPPALKAFDLPLDPSGFLATDRCLKTVAAGRPIFAVGDTGTIGGESLPKAGVYAVRQGPVLWDNIHRLLAGRPLREYRPQRSFLKLINLGDGRAIGEWKGRSFKGRWAMWLKNRIDSKFMDKYQPVPMMADATQPMQCRGCGCKLDAATLDGAIGSNGGSFHVKLEDAAEIGGDAESRLVASTDFFASPVEDAFLAGRVAALHSASDLWATGAQVTEALANVVLPEGDSQTQQRLLRDFLEGATREFQEVGGRIVGGHTIVGKRMEAGFTVIGRLLGKQPLGKAGLREGDRLYLTKPLGVGVLLAAHMRSRCHAEHYQALVASMLQSQAAYARVAADVGVVAATDITGFGLAGHLLEMLVASDLAADVQLDAVPSLPGAKEAVLEGIESSLIEGNIQTARQVAADAQQVELPGYRLLFDPQTCGGLLLGVPPELEPQMETALRESKLDAPACIGRVVPHDALAPRIRLF